MATKNAILTGEACAPLLFRHVSPGPGDSTLQFRLIHYWEACKNVKGRPGILLGIELLMIDKEGTLAQGFIGQNRHNQYEKELERGSIYTLTNFYASNIKVMYHVADQKLVICISHAPALSKVEENIEGILTERFRILSFSEFEANCDLRGDLHDVVGHLKLVDGQPLHQRPVLCTKDDSTSRRVMVHLQLKERSHDLEREERHNRRSCSPSRSRSQRGSSSEHKHMSQNKSCSRSSSPVEYWRTTRHLDVAKTMYVNSQVLLPQCIKTLFLEEFWSIVITL